MAVPPGQTYGYSPLPSETSIRLLQILSGADEPIRCSLEVADLGDEPLYDCLSYTWGDPLYHELSGPQDIRRTSNERNNLITCDGLVLCITENLREALLQLSRDASSSAAGRGQYQRQRLIWIDAVCIDQGNVPERNSQVAMMNKIYQAAKTVVVWLGIEDVHTRAAIEVMNRLSSIPPEKLKVELPPDLDDSEVYRALGIPYVEPQQWLDYAAFLQRSWFSRVWVIQEIFVARNIVVFCGSNVLLWSDISTSSQVLRETQLGELLTSVATTAVNPSWVKSSETSTTYVGNTLTNPFIFENMRKKATSLNLEKLLVYGRYFNAADDRDRVFALLGMREQSLVHRVPYHIQPDYNFNTQQVYTKASWATICEMADLNLFSLVEDASFRRLQNLPSWVPDYSVTPQTHPLSGSPRAAAGEGRWNASDGLRWEVPVQMNLLLLPVEGIRFDTIIEFAATAAEITDLHQMETLLDLLAHYPQSRYPNGGTPTEAFWRTLIKDTFRGRLAGEEARGAFPLFIALRVWELKEALGSLRDVIKYSEPKPSPPDQLTKDLTKLSDVYSQTKAAVSDLSTRYTDGIIPDWNTIERMIEIGQDEDSPEKKDLDRDYDHIAESFRVAYSGRRLFRTERNYIGITAQSLQEGDTVWVLAGATVPTVLRRLQNGNWKLVGEAYVHGIMNGEAVRGDGVKSEQILLE
ncbi:hypothetical protein FGG08_006840 [Glutinoglossum americanum]|uniref:Heterokaryon incompatibility domain-containing protein n=1 Tax=Glutinoglossum americanum TaxID=1670608 RepID=A0A9P8I021_9PEZI|nr:hypothetical protein FGG08_006840 [Glutinoglossum americanum]